MKDSSEQHKLYVRMTDRARAGLTEKIGDQELPGYYTALWDLASGAVFGTAEDILVMVRALINEGEFTALAEHYLCEAATALETAAALGA